MIVRVLFTFASAFAGAIFLVQYGVPWFVPLLAALLIGLLGIFWPNVRQRGWLLAGGLALAVGYNALYGAVVQQPMLALAGQESTVTMTLLDYPEKSSWGAKATVRIPGYFPGKAVYYGDETLLALRPGQTVTDTVAFQDASRIRDDDVTTFTSKGVFLLGYSRGEAKVGHGEADSIRFWPLRAGNAMGSILKAQYSGDSAAFLTAILTGDTSAISEQGEIALSESGLYHILAVSGMHCGYLLSIFTLLLGRHRRRLLAGVTVAAMCFYVFLTGGSPSVVRAFVMLSLVLMAPLVNRESDGPTSLSTALLLILLANPFAAASISLQLSFAAMAGMLFLPGRIYALLLPREERRRPWLVRMVVSSFAATAGALVFTIPLSGWYFGDLVLIAPVSNLLCLWAAGLAFFGGLVSVALGLLVPPLGQVISVVPGLLVEYLLWMAEYLSRLPYHALSFSNPYLKWWLLGVYVLFGAVWALRCGRRGALTAAGISAVALALTLWAGSEQYNSGLDVVVLDVGQGQCVVLKSGEEFALVDCGSSWQDAGDIAAQQLRTMGCDTLDYLVLTHYDSDHVSGVTGLLRRMETETLLVPDSKTGSALQGEILSAAQGSQVLTVRRTYHVTMGETTLTIFPPLGKEGNNERGLSLFAMSGLESLFIPGDMSQKTEKLLLEQYRVPKADVLIAGHHGAKSSTSQVLLEALDPETVCISVGSNSYGHPHQETMERLEAQGCTIYRTDQRGDIHLSLNP